MLLISGYDNLGLLNDSISKQSLVMNYLPNLLYIMDLTAIGLQNLVKLVKSQHRETENVINPHTFSEAFSQTNFIEIYPCCFIESCLFWRKGSMSMSPVPHSSTSSKVSFKSHQVQDIVHDSSLNKLAWTNFIVMKEHKTIIKPNLGFIQKIFIFVWEYKT